MKEEYKLCAKMLNLEKRLKYDNKIGRIDKFGNILDYLVFLRDFVFFLRITATDFTLWCFVHWKVYEKYNNDMIMVGFC